MMVPFDISLFVTLIGLVVVALSGLLYFDADNLLIKSHRGLSRELSKIYSDTLTKAERYSHGANVTGRKLKIKRNLGKVRKEYAIPKGILTISGLSAIGWLLCFSLAIFGFVLSSTGRSVVVNMALLTGQYNLLAMIALAWFSSKTRVDYPILFLLLSGLLWILTTTIAVATALLGWFIPVIPSDYTAWAFIIILFIPIVPVFLATGNVVSYLWREYGMFKMLKDSVEDFEKHRNDGNKKSLRGQV